MGDVPIVPIDQDAEFPLEGHWRAVGPDEIDQVINGKGSFVIEAHLPEEEELGAEAETAWAYREEGSKVIQAGGSDILGLNEILSGYVDASSEPSDKNGLSVYILTLEDLDGNEVDFWFRFFLPA